MKRLKCASSGKTIYPTMSVAKDAMFVFRRSWRFKGKMGKRVKHRRGKPAQKRTYYCTYCGGYHLTKRAKKYHSDEFDKAGYIEKT